MTAEHPIPENARTLIMDRVHSIEQLEVLLLIQQEAAKTWSVPTIADELKITASLAQSAIEHLEQHGLAVRVSGATRTWTYAPATPALGMSVAELVHSYHTARVEVLVLISTNAIDRVRTAGLRTFAKAFLLKSPKKDDG